MRSLRVVNVTRGREIGDRIMLADAWWSRLRGMLGRPAPRPGEGMLLSPCSSVHMIGMRYPLDVAFLDARGVILAAYAGLRSGCHAARHRGARCALELDVGALARSGTVVGDQVVWGETAGHPQDRDGTLLEVG